MLDSVLYMMIYQPEKFFLIVIVAGLIFFILLYLIEGRIDDERNY